MIIKNKIKYVTIGEAAKLIGVSKSLALRLANANYFKKVYYKRLQPPIYVVKLDTVWEAKERYWKTRSPEARRKAWMKYGY